MRCRFTLLLTGVCALVPLRLAAESPRFAWVDSARIAAADAEPGSWLAHGRTYDEQRFSPLTQIDRTNVGQLGLAWSFATGSRRGLEATPIVVDGVLFATGSWSVVYARDAVTGRELWTFDPSVPRWKGRNACCDVVNRGVALWKGRVYVGTIDGRLIALDAKTGLPVWDVSTVAPEQPYTITGAPRIIEDRVIIGNGGADLGVRGYFGAYDADTGQLLWRFYTVPASRSGPHEHPELELAASTWSETSMWHSSLGGTVWDSFAYDPELDLLYVGVGNSSVYDRELRSPGGGDNLFLASILAVRPESGRLVWHYQTTPGEHWDYTATQHMILADLTIGGRLRKVLMQAPKNGFFYVLDRATGELLSAENYVDVSWATHIDLTSGRPVERSEAHWSKERAVVTPGIPGGILATAGDLVFQGHGGGVVAAYDAANGERLWQEDVGVGVMAPPVTYAVDGTQYVAVMAGIGGSHGGHFVKFDNMNDGRLLVFKLGGEAKLPPARPRPPKRNEAPEPSASPETVARGRDLYSHNCLFCHGMGAASSGLHPDLRHASRAVHESWNDIVLGGQRQGSGMASFADRLSVAESDAIHSYVISRAHHEPGLLESLARWAGRYVCVPAAWMAD